MILWAKDEMLFKYIFQHITYMKITGNNPEKPIYTGLGHFCPGYTDDCGIGGLCSVKR